MSEKVRDRVRALESEKERECASGKRFHSLNSAHVFCGAPEEGEVS